MRYSPPSRKGPNLSGYNPAAGAPESGRPLPPPATPHPEDLSNRALLNLLTEVAHELELRSKMQLGPFRDEFERTISDSMSELEKLTPARHKRTEASGSTSKSGLSPAKIKAVRAACEAGVPRGQVAKHFGISRADIQNALSEPE